MEVKDLEFASGNGISNVTFSFFNAERVRKTSVKQITRSATFDRLGRPQRDGLYDAALGPVDPLERCATCAQSYDDCPGHYGHIELALPVFHPLLFNELYKLLRHCCLGCRALKMGADRKKYFVYILSLIRRGKLAQAGNALAYEEGYMDPAFSIAEPDEVMDAFDVRDKFQNKTAHQQEMWAEAIAACMGAMPNKCAQCGNVSASLKKDGYSRILKKPLTKRQRAQGDGKKSPVASSKAPVKKSGRAADESDEEPAARTKRKKAAGKHDEDSESSDEESDDESDEDADVMESEVKEKDGDLQDDALPVNVTPLKALELLQQVFKRDGELLGLVYGAAFNGRIKGEASMFFLQTLLIAPNRFRPPVQLGEQQFEHPINAALKEVMLQNDEMFAMLKDKDVSQAADAEAGGLDSNKLMEHWHSMQISINNMIDSTKGEKKEKDLAKGVRQELERKEGLMRMNMMGKRVNFACRSVISPDPFMTTAEVGIPEVFAKRLSWPEPVNQYNVRRLRQAVLNGPDVWPGANYVIDEKGTKVDLSKKGQQFRTALAKQLERTDKRGVNWKVGRHLNHGDFVLVNRQPTLHKVSLMAHKVRVNKGQRVIRMHYANCKSYNADFDGDEINVHFPQDQLGRAEAATIVQNDLQYIVPTDGSPIRGLIQDHVIAGVQICQINRCFTKDEYSELVFLMLTGLAADLGLPDNLILTVPPAYVKPLRRWTGKQIITTILINLLHDCPPLNTESGCKVKGVMVGQHKHEERVVVRGNDFLTGCLDKNQIGSSAEGIVHAVFESYGANKAGLLLTIFGRLFTHFQQVHRAFTCGVYDLMVTDDGNAKRREILATANRRTLDSSANFAELNFDGDKDGKGAEGKLDAKELDRRRRLVHSALAHKLHEEKGRKLNDSRIMQSLAPVTSGVIDAILPKGQMVAFPENNFEMMTGTGAKGSKVNMSQICCLLGQQQLEGQRVPVMASGKTLPCFTALETDARAGGYIADRFLTGIRPQEYFFHCMSGREGLVDTAVKTSRSGYLQRCLVKHLESLTVAYDRTVRDNDGGIHQFLYGEDGIDPVKQLGLKWLSHLADNSAATLKTIHESTLDKMDRKAVKDHQKQVRKIAKSKGISYQQARRDLPPLTSIGYADTHLGFVSENFEDFVDGYIAKYKDLPTSPALLRGGGDAAFKQLAFFKYAKAMAQPGEPVGATAAQSIGEPSTQMTLNTFHSAGQGNATAGIPRLRELIMTASKKPANPTMTLPLDRSKIDSVAQSKELAETVAQQLSRVCISDFLNSVEVADTIVPVSSDVGYMREYKIQVFLEPEHMLTANLRKCTAARNALPGILETTFTFQALAAVEKEAAKDSKGKGLDIVAGAGERAGKGEEEEEEEARGKGKGEEDSGESSDEEDASEDEGDAKKEHKKSVKGFLEADKADRKAVKKGSKAAATANAMLQDDDQDDDAMDEDEASGADDSITLVKATPRELDKLKALTDKYRAKTSYETEGQGGKGVFVVTLRVPASRRRIMMVALIEGVAAKCVVQELPGVLQTHVVEPSKKEGMDKNFSIVTEGANLDLFTLWQVNRQKNIKGALDLTRVTCNDISQIRRTLGVEAARKTLFDEIAGIFGAYGIGVDSRHVSLISDSMMYSGDHRPMNRIGMKHSASPLLKMSFETTCTFLIDATAGADSDNLESPSSRLILGRPVKAGTGFFDLRLQLAAAKGS